MKSPMKFDELFAYLCLVLIVSLFAYGAFTIGHQIGDIVRFTIEAKP
jgi:hypothetical protein